MAEPFGCGWVTILMQEAGSVYGRGATVLRLDYVAFRKFLKTPLLGKSNLLLAQTQLAYDVCPTNN